jgi:LAS superfamily LD-carboxypeptidase LdcB
VDSRTIAAAIAAIAAALVVIAACGGFSSSSTSDSVLATPTPTATRPGPVITASPIPDETYIVQPGDTLSVIAALYNVTVGELMAANGIEDPLALQPGMVLRIPGVPASVRPTPTPGPTSDPGATQPPEVTLLQLVDKQHPLPDGYAPDDLISVTFPYIAPGYTATLRSEAYSAIVEMLDAAAVSGHDIRVVSGYRSYQDQVVTYQRWVDTLGEEEANRISAKPGYSEHQLGTTADLGSADFGWDLTEGFGATPAGKWLQNNCDKFGFALSYPPGKESITGYAYEPWHFRYIGREAAADWKASGLTLNQFLGA